MIRFPLRNIATDGHASNCTQNPCKCWKAPAPGLKWRELTDSMEDGLSPAYGLVLDDKTLVVDIDPRNGGVKSFSSFLQDFPDFPWSTYSVVTGKNEGQHYYLSLPEPMRLRSLLPQYPGLEFRGYGTYVCAPGSVRGDNGGLYTVKNDGPKLLAPPSLLKALEKSAPRVETSSNEAGEMSMEDVQKCLKLIPTIQYREYEDWIRIGIAIWRATGGSTEGFELWVSWSIQDERYANVDSDDLYYKWSSFEGGEINYKTLIHEGAKYGYTHSHDNVASDFKPIEPSQKDTVKDRTAPKDWVWVTQLGGYVNKNNGHFLTSDKLRVELSYFLLPSKMKLSDALNTGIIDRCYQLTYQPRQEPWITDPHGYRSFNLWRSSDLKPKAGSVELFMELLTYLFGDDSEHFLDWMAMVVQGIRPRYMVVLYTLKHQMGKSSILGEALTLMVGRHNQEQINKSILEGQFNGYLQHSTLIIVEELFGGANKLQICNKLKEMITESYITIRMMRTDPYKMPNYACFLAYTNYRDALILKADDPRILALECAKDPLPKEFYKELTQYMFEGEKEGTAALYQCLLERDVKGLKYMDAPHTAARQHMSQEGRGEPEVMVEDLILAYSTKNYSNYFVCPTLHSIGLANHFTHRISATQIGKVLARFGYDQGRIKINEVDYRIYISPLLRKKYPNTEERRNFIREKWKKANNFLHFLREKHRQ